MEILGVIEGLDILEVLDALGVREIVGVWENGEMRGIGLRLWECWQGGVGGTLCRQCCKVRKKSVPLCAIYIDATNYIDTRRRYDTQLVCY